MIGEYIEKINQRFKLSNAAENTLSGDLQLPVEPINPKFQLLMNPNGNETKHLIKEIDKIKL